MGSEKKNGQGLLAKLQLDHLRGDLLAAISVALVALPLGLGIALASGAPPISGLIAAIVGGLITTFIRSSHVAVNGPGAGLIVVVLGGVEAMGDGGVDGFQYVLAAIVVAGGIQALLGILKLGELGELLPTSVLHGMLAAIGLIILGKQLHVALGADTVTYSALDAFMKVPVSLAHFNPFVTIIAVVGLVLLVVHPKIQNRLIHAIPSALWVLLVSIPLVFAFNLFQAHDIIVLDRSYHVGPDYLIEVPDRPWESILFPNFSKIGTAAFWVTVLGVLLLGTIETLVSTKAVDKLDPEKRRTNLNRDLIAVGISTAVSGFIGGLPVVTVIVRSSVNVNHGARTRWSNFFHGLILLVLVIFFPWFIREIPKAALAAILIYTGYKLASPKVFRDMAQKGWEQLLFFTVTLVACVVLDLLWGILVGILITLVVQWLRSQLTLATFLRHAFHPDIIAIAGADGHMFVRVKGIANFFSIRKLQNTIKGMPKEGSLTIDLSQARLVDNTVLDLIHEHGERNGRSVELLGLDAHRTSSSHPHALHVLKKPVLKRLTVRQIGLLRHASGGGHDFEPGIMWDVAQLSDFPYLGLRIAAHRSNIVRGVLGTRKVPFEIFDLTYSEGVLMADEEHSLTMAVIRIPGLSSFTVTREEMVAWQDRNGSDLGFRRLFDKLGSALFGDRDAEEILEGMPAELAPYLRSQDPYFVSATKSGILVFDRERLASLKEMAQLERYCQGIVEILAPQAPPESDHDQGDD